MKLDKDTIKHILNYLRERERYYSVKLVKADDKTLIPRSKIMTRLYEEMHTELSWHYRKELE